jgi:hypothetical protein
MKRTIAGLAVKVLAMTALGFGYANAQTPGMVPIFDQAGTGTCNAGGGNDCIDSSIFQDVNSGRIGIGTMTPFSLFHVQNGGTPLILGPFNAVIGECTFAGCAGVIGSVQNGQAGVIGVAFGSGAAVQGQAFGASTLAGDFQGEVRISGYLGVGTGGASDRITLPNDACPNGCGLARFWGTYSSIRYKENVRQIDHPLEKVNQLRGVYYNDKSDGRHDVGVIAEEVGKVLPEIVQYEANGTDARSMDYSRLTALLIEAVKELRTENDMLKTRIDVLERK